MPQKILGVWGSAPKFSRRIDLVSLNNLVQDLSWTIGKIKDRCYSYSYSIAALSTSTNGVRIEFVCRTQSAALARAWSGRANASVNRAAANQFSIDKPRDPQLRLNRLFVGTSHRSGCYWPSQSSSPNQTQAAMLSARARTPPSMVHSVAGTHCIPGEI